MSDVNAINDAFQDMLLDLTADLETGSHHFNNAASAEFTSRYPSLVAAMLRLANVIHTAQEKADTPAPALNPGDRFVSLSMEVDTDEYGAERYTPIGAIWVVMGVDISADCACIACPETGACINQSLAQMADPDLFARLPA